MKAVYLALGMKITKEKLGQAVPVVGIVVGAGLNARMLRNVVDDAEHLYRERFLCEKYGIAQPDTAASAESAIFDAEVVDIVDIVDTELERGADEPDGSGITESSLDISPEAAATDTDEGWASPSPISTSLRAGGHDE